MKGAGFVGNGCVAAAFSPRQIRRRHRPFLDRPQRLTGNAIEHK
jgi:hypothetical protein